VISEVLQVLNNANVNVASLNVTRAGAGQVRLRETEPKRTLYCAVTHFDATLFTAS
jgi:hypothetical protein